MLGGRGRGGSLDSHGWKSGSEVSFENGKGRASEGSEHGRLSKRGRGGIDSRRARSIGSARNVIVPSSYYSLSTVLYYSKAGTMKSLERRQHAGFSEIRSAKGPRSRRDATPLKKTRRSTLQQHWQGVEATRIVTKVSERARSVLADRNSRKKGQKERAVNRIRTCALREE